MQEQETERSLCRETPLKRSASDVDESSFDNLNYSGAFTVCVKNSAWTYKQLKVERRNFQRMNAGGKVESQFQRERSRRCISISET